MRIVLQPADCPECTAGLSVCRYRPVRWSPGAVLLFAVGCVGAGGLLLVARPYSVVAAEAALRLLGYDRPPGGGPDLVQWLELRYFLSWILFALAFLAALVPAYLCGRIARRMSRRVHLECPACGWRGRGRQHLRARPRRTAADRETRNDEPFWRG
jgi:hypothetical protein